MTLKMTQGLLEHKEALPQGHSTFPFVSVFPEKGYPFIYLWPQA